MKRISLACWMMCCGGVLLGEEFIISYRAKIENSLFKGEDYRVSKVIDAKGSRGLEKGSFKVIKECQITPLESLDQDGVERFLKQNKERVLECLYSSGVKIYDEVMTKNWEARSKTIFKIPPKRVVVILSDGMVKLSVLEKK